MGRKHTQVDRLIYQYEDLSDEQKKEARKRIIQDWYSDREEAEKQANIVLLSNYMGSLAENIKNRGKVRGLKTGYWTLDRMTAGLCGGDLDVIAAPSSVGKSMLIVNMFVRQMLEGHKIFLITLEMTKESILERMHSILGEELFEVAMSNGGIMVQEQARIPYTSVKYAVEKAKEWGAEVVYIDHLHYFSRSMQNQAEGLGVITQEFKVLALEHDIPIVLISQLRKTEAGQRPTGDDLRGSALIKQDADIVLILDKDPKDMNGPNSHVRVTLDKNRDRLIWGIDSSIKLTKLGLDLEEVDYNETDDMERDVTGKPRGVGSQTMNIWKWRHNKD